MRFKVGVIILNYNNIDDTINCIESVVENSDTDGLKFVVVDNGSSIHVVEAVRNYLKKRFLSYTEGGEVPGMKTLPQMTYLCLSENLGYARGNNAGADLLYSDPEINQILILNNDILFTSDIIPVLQKNLEILPDAAIISPLLYKKDNTSVDYNCARNAASLAQLFFANLFCGRNILGIRNRYLRKQYVLGTQPFQSGIIKIELPSGSCMLVDKMLFQQIGSFDPHTFLYYEENILWAKVQRLGLSNYIDTTVSCIHLGAATTRTQKPNKFISECSIQSLDYYLRNYTNAGWVYLSCMKLFYQITRLKIRLKTLYSS